MKALLQQLVELLKRTNDAEVSEFIWKQFHAMEQRYHTWMNYYSLFNGALLVAYCTLIVSTGTVIKNQCGMNTTYELECGYWGFLSLIALLGVLASYCWLLSMIGHNHWLDNWRRKLQDRYQSIMRDISGDPSLDSQLCKTWCGKIVLPGFYSTYKVTKVFIWSVIIAWIMIFIYALSKYVDFHLSIACIMLTALLIILVFSGLQHVLLYGLLGSNLNKFTINGKSIDKTEISFCKMLSDYLCSSGCHILKVVSIGFCITIFFLIFCQECCIKSFLMKLWNSLFSCCCCQ